MTAAIKAFKDITMSPSQVNEVLGYLGVTPSKPDIRLLNRLIQAYTRKVPWESVSRIIKRHTTIATADCPRWPQEFWQDAMSDGLGGTCFESSLAFYSLLRALGYRGYLTVNAMGETPDCHAAIILLLKGQKYLVDNTIPLHKAIILHREKISKRRTNFHTYTIRPLGAERYQVERSHHPHRYSFTLIDKPVSIAAYRKIVRNDYGDGGIFLDRLVINKVVGDRVWLFWGDGNPYKLVGFNRSGRVEMPLSEASLVPTLSEQYGLQAEQVAQALRYLDARV